MKWILMFVLSVITVFSFSCKEESHHQHDKGPGRGKIKQSDLMSVKPEEENITKRRIEILDKRKISINGNLGFSISQEELIAAFGQPNAVKPADFKCGAYIAGQEPWGNIVELWYYSSCTFITYKDKADLMQIDFKKSDITLEHPKIILSNELDIQELKRVFPKSCAHLKNMDLKGPKSVSLQTGMRGEDQWQLHFEDEKLTHIVYWSSC